MTTNALHVHRSNSKSHSATSVAAQHIFPEKVGTVAVVEQPAPKPVGRIVQASSYFCDLLQQTRIYTSASTQSKTRQHRKGLRNSRA
jgi:hypothetical protein